jgi:ABC-type multidrug transport system fused ATPase/permease subunit
MSPSEVQSSPGSQQPPSVRTNLLRLLRYLQSYWKEQMATLFFLVVGTGASLLVPLLVRKLLDVALPDRDVALLLRLVVAMAGVHLLYMVFMFVTDYFFLKVSNSILFDLRRDMYDHLLRLSMNYFEGAKTGQVLARIMGDVDAVQTLTTNAFLMLLTDSFSLLLMLGFMLYLSWQMTLVGVGALVALMFIFRVFNQRLLGAGRTSRQQYAQISGDLQEAIVGIREIKAFTHESLRRQAFAQRLRDFFQANFRLGIWGSVSRLLSLLVVALAPVIVYFYSGWGVIQGTLTIGTLVAFATYLGRIYEPIQRLTFINIQVQSAMGAVERIFAFLGIQPVIQEDEAAMPLPQIQGEIVLKDVNFDYGRGDGLAVLENINLRIRPGEKVALVGTSGAGKSTIANLICRFYDTQEGGVYLDGLDVRKLKLDDLRRHIGIVPQDTFLFHASVAENLRLGKPAAALEELETAARLAHADEFIGELPQGYETIVGERGMKLSGGQKQRLSIARVILKDPQIVIFDEATSSLDSESERLVKASMDWLMQGRTTIIISHRLSTVADADRILVLDKGRIVEEGTHQTLMEREGIYWQLYEQQAREPKLQVRPGFEAVAGPLPSMAERQGGGLGRNDR